MVGRGGDRFDVVDRRRGAVEPHAGRERRLHPRHPLLALERLEHRGFFAADVGARAVMDIEVERPAVDVVPADQFRLIGLFDRGLKALALLDVFAAEIDVGGLGAHREGGDQRAFDQHMRIVAQDLPILAGAGLGFVGVDDEIVRPLRVDGLRHERPFEPGREARPAAAAQARGLHFRNDPVAALVDQRLRAVPVAARARALQAAVAETVEIGEDPVLVFAASLRLPASCRGGRARRRPSTPARHAPDWRPASPTAPGRSAPETQDRCRPSGFPHASRRRSDRSEKRRDRADVSR